MVRLTKDLEVLRPRLQRFLNKIFEKEKCSDLLGFKSCLEEFRSQFDVYENEVYAKRSIRHRLPTVVIAYSFTFLDTVGYIDARQVCSTWFKASKSSMLVSRLFRELKTVESQDSAFTFRQTFVPSETDLLMPWFSQPLLMSFNTGHFGKWSEFGVDLEKMQDIWIMAKNDRFVLYEYGKCIYLYVIGNFSGIQQTYGDMFKVHHQQHYEIKRETFCFDGNKLFTITNAFQLYVYDLNDFPVKPMQCRIINLLHLKNTPTWEFVTPHLCIDGQYIYVFAESFVGASSSSVRIWCLDKVTFEKKDGFSRNAQFTVRRSLKDCRVQNGLFFWGGRNDDSRVYVVCDRLRGKTYRHFVDYLVRGILWNNAVLFYDPFYENFFMWDTKFTKVKQILKKRHKSLVLLNVLKRKS